MTGKDCDGLNVAAGDLVQIHMRESLEHIGNHDGKRRALELDRTFAKVESVGLYGDGHGGEAPGVLITSHTIRRALIMAGLAGKAFTIPCQFVRKVATGAH